MTEALVTGSVVSWALERAEVSVEEAADHLKVTPEKVGEWQEERAYPTLRQAEKLARKCHVPFGYLFLSRPPEDPLPLPDLRTIANRPITNPSSSLVDVVQDVLRKQDWYREYLEDEGAAPLDFVGRFSADDKAVTIAADIRNTIGLDDDLRRGAGNWENFLDLLARRAEGAGVLVFRSSYVASNTWRPLAVAEFQGFAFVDPLAPVVFINASDWKSAQIFTLAHELAHVWIGESGISNLDYRKRSSDQRVGVDRLSDQIAAETLVPSHDFTSSWDEGRSTGRNLEALANTFKVSQFVILRRAYENRLVDDAQFRAHYDELRARDRPPAPPKKRQGDFYRGLPIRNSRLFTATILSATRTGRVSYRTAARLLNVQPPVLATAYQKLAESGA